MNLLTYIMFVLLPGLRAPSGRLGGPITTSIKAPAGGSSFDPHEL